MVPGPFGWEDLGDFASLATLLPGDADGLKVLGDESLVVSRGSSGLVVPAAGRTVAVVGLEDVVVVDTGDALLVTTYAHAQQVKAVPEVLERERAAGPDLRQVPPGQGASGSGELLAG